MRGAERRCAWQAPAWLAAGLLLSAARGAAPPPARGDPGAPTAAAAGALVAWVPTVSGTAPPMADAMARVPRTAPAGPDLTAEVYAARGETQGFPIVVKAPAGRSVTRLAVSASPLSCSSGACRGKSIAAHHLDFYRAVYQTVRTPSGPGDPLFKGRIHANGPPGSNTLSDPGNRSMCGRGRPFGPAPCHVPDGLVPYRKCGDGSASPCREGDPGSANPCAIDGTACGAGAPSLAVAAGTNQQLWIEIRIPRGRAGTPAGTYSGQITLTAEAGGPLAAIVPLNLHVWDFELPRSPSFRTGFGFNGGSQPSVFYNVEAQELFAKHEVSLARYGSTTVMGVDDWPRDDYGPTAARLAEAWGVPNALQVGTFHGVTGSDCVTSWSRSDYLTTEAAQAWVATYRLPTSGVLLYARNGDEVVSGLAEAGHFPYPFASQRRRADGGPGCAETCGWCTYRYMREAARQVHATRDPAIEMLSVVDPNPHLVRDTADLGGDGRPALDVFVAAPGYGWESPSALASVRSNATPSELWTYLIRVPDLYSPKWQLDYSPVAYRMGFISQALGVSGAAIAEIADRSELGCDAGPSCPGRRSRPPDNPWLDGLHKNVCGGRAAPNCDLNGDSQWLYPGSQVGLGRWSVVPHLRLKFLRDGIQDYEYIQILKTLSGGGYARGGCTQAFPGRTCAQVVAAVGGEDWSSYSTDTHLLQRARKAIGDAIAADARRPAGAP